MTYAQIIHDGKVNIIPVSEDIEEEDLEAIKRGALVHVKKGNTPKGEFLSIVAVDKAKDKLHGYIGTIQKDLDDNLYEVEVRGEHHLCYSEEQIDVGKQVSIDESCTFINHVLKSNKEADYKIDETQEVKWEQVGGLEDAKTILKEIIEIPYLYADLYAAFHKKPSKGALLYGPPGCGKTLLAKAVATSLSKGEGQGGFIYVKGPEILNPYVGVAESNVRKLFAESQRYYQETGHPAVIFIDEADSVLYKRGTGKSSDVERTIVAQFLSEMDGLENSGAVVLLATNRPDTLDPAVVREGRIDKKVFVGRPELNAAKQILDIHLGEIPLAEIGKDKLVDEAISELYSKDRILYKIKLSSGQQNFTLGNLVSGAMVASIVDTATTVAIRRKIADSDSLLGITSDDMRRAIAWIHEMNVNVSHEEDIANFVEPFGEKIQDLQKMGI